jgi:hypothetical protein
MFLSSDPSLDHYVTGLLWIGGVVYGFGAVLLVARMHALPGRERILTRLAHLVNAAPALVGLACLALLIGAVSGGLRPGHEEEFLALLARPLPAVAMLSSAAGFLAGLLGTARPSRTALALGGPITFLSMLIAAAVLGVVALVLPDAPDAAERLWTEHAALAHLFTSLALFPTATLGLSWVSARLGRLILGWLRLE